MMCVNRAFFRLLILALSVNFSMMGVKPPYLLAQTDEQELAATDEKKSLAAEVLKEINRARTNPQSYAEWLEEQKQYYDGILLKLPGEKPVRSNKGLKALEEAISFLQEQEPLSPLSASKQLTNSATAQIKNLANNQLEGNISYGRVTPQGIVMNLVVDAGFPDRRHRKNLFNPDVELAGVICQPNDYYERVCAIAYEGEEGVEVATETNGEEQEQGVEVAAEPDVEENSTVQVDPNSGGETLPAPPQVAANSESTESDTTEISEEEKQEEIEVAENIQEENEEQSGDIVISEEEQDDEESEDTEVSDEDDEEEEDDVEVSDEDDEEEEDVEVSDEDDEDSDEDDENSEDVEVSDDEQQEEESSTVATPSNNSRLLEKTKRGVLEDGDKIIPDDGSLYDSYPLEGKAGESFIISLESDEFDTFVAVMDAEGKILDQNDDIDKNNSNSRLRITLPNDGVYNVIVNAYDEGGKGRYTLTVRR